MPFPTLYQCLLFLLIETQLIVQREKIAFSFLLLLLVLTDSVAD